MAGGIAIPIIALYYVSCSDRTILQKFQYVGVLAFATVDGLGNPQLRNINAMHYEPDTMHFLQLKARISAVNCLQKKTRNNGLIQLWNRQNKKRGRF